ncbi:hypothetical protein HU200_033543 [Digitaria exilis]|uniref:Peroxidase n=1 Tax=Digitaria exilis TaxID=1010633 RepID=A0A835BRL0_9POAL|nr:hypothetical protein HU200_033543 [Digitaria exilis]
MAASFRPWILVSCTLLLAAACHALQVGFYQKTCPSAEALVRAEVQKAVVKDAGLGAGLIRMLFHDCFVEPTELRGDRRGEGRRGEGLPNTVSCADIIAFAARDASDLHSGSKIRFAMPGGRFDGRRSQATQTNALPPPFGKLSDLTDKFTAKRMSVEDLVVLSGAHSIVRSHCSSFVPERVSSPSDMDASLVSQLKNQCPASPGPGNDPVVAEDVVTPNALDNQYYQNVLDHKVLFPSDAALMSLPQTAQMVRDLARKDGSWEKKFAAAMVKLASIGVKTSRDGEIRKNCRVVK